MYRFWFGLLRELRLLGRDRSGLALLFVMPAVLVVVITLVQDNVFKDQGGTRLEGVVVDLDGGEAAGEVVRHLAAMSHVALVHGPDERSLDEERVLAAVRQGRYRFAVVLPDGMTARVRDGIGAEIEAMLSGNAGAAPRAVDVPVIRYYLDPTVTGGYGAAVTGALHQAVAAMYAAIRMQALEQEMNRRIARLNEALAEIPGGEALPVLTLAGQGDVPVTVIEAHHTAFLPTAVQQNVPAWALFGMFFVAVPLAGGMIHERRQGITARLMTMPVPRLTLLTGKLSAYVLVCLMQFGLILLVGHGVLPRLGTAALSMGEAYGALVLVVLCSALAATGFGVLLGTLARTHEQATTLGPIAVVIAAALGGLMVPVFAMPPGMQALSRISPLAWGQDAFLVLFVRGGDLHAVTGQLTALLLFAAGTLVAALLAAQWRRRRD